MMDLRDQFAMAAMQGELASQRGGCEWANESHLAARAYGVADAMIAEREQLALKCIDKSLVLTAWIPAHQEPKDGQKCLVVMEVEHSKDDCYRFLEITSFNDGCFDSIANYEDQANSVGLPAGSTVSKLRAVCWTPFNLSNNPLNFDEFGKELEEQTA